jgi:hypothetical protein
MTEISTEIQSVSEPQGEGRKPLQAAALKCRIEVPHRRGIDQSGNEWHESHHIAFTCCPATDFQQARRFNEGGG